VPWWKQSGKCPIMPYKHIPKTAPKDVESGALNCSFPTFPLGLQTWRFLRPSRRRYMFVFPARTYRSNTRTYIRQSMPFLACLSSKLVPCLPDTPFCIFSRISLGWPRESFAARSAWVFSEPFPPAAWTLNGVVHHWSSGALRAVCRVADYGSST